MLPQQITYCFKSALPMPFDSALHAAAACAAPQARLSEEADSGPAWGGAARPRAGGSILLMEWRLARGLL